MKILHFHKSLGAGGIESMVCNLANEMSKTQDVTVGTIFLPNSNDLFYNKLHPGVKKINLGKTDDTTKPFKEIYKAYSAIKKGHYDIVHIHGYFYYYLLAIWLLHRKVTFFYTLHSDAFHESPPWDLKLMRIKRMFFRKGWMKAITISPASQQSFIALYGCPSAMITNGIASPEISDSISIIDSGKITEQTKVFINAGRVCEAKNQVMLCRVFDRLIKIGFDVQLYIAGGIQDKQIYSEMSPYFSDRIIFLDEVNNVPSLMAKADGMCLSSIYEGLPVVILEALATGCIPICTPVGGCADVITDGVNGFLSESTDEGSYYSTITRFLSIPENELESIKKQAVKSFDKYNISKTTDSYLKEYKKALNHK